MVKSITNQFTVNITSGCWIPNYVVNFAVIWRNTYLQNGSLKKPFGLFLFLIHNITAYPDFQITFVLHLHNTNTSLKIQPIFSPKGLISYYYDCYLAWIVLWDLHLICQKGSTSMLHEPKQNLQLTDGRRKTCLFQFFFLFHTIYTVYQEIWQNTAFAGVTIL